MSISHKPMILCILDGWGHSNKLKYNAIAQAKLPFFSKLMKEMPMTFLEASGRAVGLPVGQMGNSEVGHMTIGAGRVILQDLERINTSIEKKDFQLSDCIKKKIDYLRLNKKSCHLIGLASDGGVHSHINHFLEYAKLMRENGIDTFIHIIADGRDVAPKSAINYINKFINLGFDIATVSGRFYAMDRDERFERTELYYKTLLNINDKKFSNLFDVIEKYESDEFIEPHSSCNYGGIKDGDLVFMINFRADRVRQIMSSLLDPDFRAFETRKLKINGLGMASYSKKLDQLMDTIFPEQIITKTLGEVISRNNLRQLRIAETEKYAHVTYFFNCGKEEKYRKEDRIMIPSPKVFTYDTCPEMSAYKLTAELIKCINKKKYNFICVNFANADMVGHTANMAAAIKACEVIDDCLEKISKVLEKHDVDMFITSDHGNVEQLFNCDTNQLHTAHTINNVPLIYVGNKKIGLRSGQLSDIAPTILSMLDIDIPIEMEGRVLYNFLR